MATKTYRDFSGTDEIDFSVGSISNLGAWTWGALMRFQTDGVNSIFGGYTSPSTYRYSVYKDVDTLIHTDPGTAKTVTTFTAADDWFIFVMSKASGTVAPRAHFLKTAGGAWSHENCTGTQQNFTSHNLYTMSLADVHEMDVYWHCWWNSQLSDGAIEAIAPTGYMDDAALLASGVSALWYFDQAAVTDSVTDETGGGANQSARTGTAVSSDDIPFYASVTTDTVVPDSDESFDYWTVAPLWPKVSDSSDGTVITATAS